MFRRRVSAVEIVAMRYLRTVRSYWSPIVLRVPWTNDGKSVAVKPGRNVQRHPCHPAHALALPDLPVVDDLERPRAARDRSFLGGRDGLAGKLHRGDRFPVEHGYINSPG